MNKDKIKDRILKNASRYWGYTEMEMETSFDPIVGLLLEAVSSELEKISSEINNSETRIVERILEIMFPDVTTGVIPAQAIMHSVPVENNFKVSLRHQFHTNKKIYNIYNPNNSELRELYMGATAEFKLAAAKISYISYGNKLLELDDRVHYKNLVAKRKEHLPLGTMWVGLELGNDVNSLDDLMFYIDIRNMHQKEIFFYYLKLMKCFYHDKEIKISEGYNVDNNELDIDGVVRNNYSHMIQVCNNVNDYYRTNFYTVKDSIDVNEEYEEDNPQKLFKEDFKEVKGKTIWLKFIFAEFISSEVLDSVIFSINCFPIINKHYQSFDRRLDPVLKYFPLETEDSYLDINNVISPSGKHYEIRNFGNSFQEGTAVVRRGGVLRFDSRTASELLQYLLELLKDESAAFSGLGQDFAKESLQEINQKLASIEQEAKQNKFVHSNYPYLMIKTQSEMEYSGNFHVSYWSTCGEMCNDLKPGIKLDTPGNSDFISDTIILVTPTVGGKSRQTNKEKIFSYRNAILTRGRIVTIADIRAFCFSHFKDLIKDIKITKGTKKEISVKEGFSRTIDITLILDTELTNQINETEWYYICDNFMRKLNNISSNVYPYRLFIENNLMKTNQFL